jgi:hypothetical protein
MRLFELITYGKPYLSYFAASGARRSGDIHEELKRALLHDRYGNSHLLDPIERGSADAFLSVADDELSQRAWAREKGLPSGVLAEDIVLAQIEEHRTEVFYNISPILYDSRFLRRLPGSVKRTLCWRAAPVGHSDLSQYDRCVCNFQGLLDQWSQLGWKTAWFEPAHDPVASDYGRNTERSVDVAFVGGYSRHHGKRNLLLQRIAELGREHDIRFHFSLGRAAQLVNWLWPMRWLMPHLALEGALRGVARPALYGREMYRLFGTSRIVINAAIDMATEFRGNMRCWEALGCGAVMLSDEGIYPRGMRPGRDFETYRDVDDALMKIERILADYEAWRPMAAQGLATVETTYSKAAQWEAFVKLVDSI